MTTQGRTFDCVAMKRRIQERIYEEAKEMTSEELGAYFRTRARQGPFGVHWQQATAKDRDNATRLRAQRQRLVQGPRARSATRHLRQQ